MTIKMLAEVRNIIVLTQTDVDNSISIKTGDSGGPLQIVGNSRLAIVVGVVSFGKGCPSELPGVYSRVAHFLEWIEDIVWTVKNGNA